MGFFGFFGSLGISRSVALWIKNGLDAHIVVALVAIRAQIQVTLGALYALVTKVNGSIVMMMVVLLWLYGYP